MGPAYLGSLILTPPPVTSSCPDCKQMNNQIVLQAQSQVQDYTHYFP